MRRFYFTSDSHCDGDNPCNDHCGNIRGARTIAQKLANELDETVYINDCETGDIVDCIEPDSILDEISEPVESELDETSESVENESFLTFEEISYLMGILQCRINDNEIHISFINDSSFYSEANASIISRCTKSIEHDKSILKKLYSLGLEVSKNERT